MIMEVEAFIFGKKIGTILLKDGFVYFEYKVVVEQLNLVEKQINGILTYGDGTPVKCIK